MKLSISKGELLQALGRIQAIVEKRNSMPILANVPASRQAETRQDSSSPPPTSRSAFADRTRPRSRRRRVVSRSRLKKLFEIVRELPDDEVHPVVHTELLSRDPLRARSLHPGRDGARGVSDASRVFSPGTNWSPSRQPCLSSMIERTMYAASLDETRYNLNGVYLEVLEDDGQDPHGGHRRPPAGHVSTGPRARSRRALERGDHPPQGPRRAEAAGRRGRRRRDRARVRGQQRSGAQGRMSRS